MARFVLFLLSTFLFFNSYGQHPLVHQVDPTEFRTLIQQLPGTLLDVRTLGEFNNGHIAHAGQLNYYALDFRKKLLLLPKDQAIYLYCNTGWRSIRAAQFLIENGYPSVYNLEKGFMDWELNDFAVVTEPNANADSENIMEPAAFRSLVQSEPAVFFDFYAPWCGPCQKMMPLIDSLKIVYKGKITTIKINADASKKLVKELHLGSVPYLVFYRQGKKVFEHYGSLEPAELEHELKSNYLLK